MKSVSEVPLNKFSFQSSYLRSMPICVMMILPVFIDNTVIKPQFKELSYIFKLCPAMQYVVEHKFFLFHLDPHLNNITVWQQGCQIFYNAESTSYINLNLERETLNFKP